MPQADTETSTKAKPKTSGYLIDSISTDLRVSIGIVEATRLALQSDEVFEPKTLSNALEYVGEALERLHDETTQFFHLVGKE